MIILILKIMKNFPYNSKNNEEFGNGLKKIMKIEIRLNKINKN